MVVLYEKRGHIGYITLNRPEVLNAMNSEVNERLREIWLEIRDDPDIWVAIVTGAGDRAFSAGVDVKEVATRISGGSIDPSDLWSLYAGQTLESGLEVWKPVIAAINGYCLGIGCTLILACDFRIASERASFGFPEVKRGIPTIMGSLRLPQVTGVGPALELLLTGDFMDAQEAYRVGLVHKVVPHEKLMEEAERWAERLLANAPVAVRVTKELVLRGLETPFPQAWRMGEGLRRIAMQSEDFQEGIKAFLEKRKPEWKGR